MTIMPPKAPLSHSRPLDGLRFFAFFAVFVAHGLAQYTTTGTNPFVVHGVRGVTVFFVLSGFLIGRGLLLQHAQRAQRGGASLRELLRVFYLRRALRIFPLYYAVIVALVFLRGPLDIPYPDRALPWHLAYLANVGVFVNHSWIGGAGHFWTLSVEEHFYLLAPLVLLVASRRAVSLGCAAIVALVIAARGAIAVQGITPWALVLSPMHFDALCIGIVAAIIDLDGAFLGVSRRTYVRAGAVAALLFCAVVWASDGAARDESGRIPRLVSATLADGLLAAGSAAAVLVLAEGRTAAARIVGWGPIAYAGRISYCPYLVHPFCLHLLQRDYVLVSAFGAYGTCALALAATTAIATASWFGFERPILRIKDRFAPASVRSREDEEPRHDDDDHRDDRDADEDQHAPGG
jgi:peptidoglycan/LPS O-acetylase OafA/YrhL